MIGGRGLLNEMQKRSNYWERNTERVIDEILNSASTFRKKLKKRSHIHLSQMQIRRYANNFSYEKAF